MDFVSIDFETANFNRGSICSVGLAVVEGGAIKENLEWLVKPPREFGWFDEFNIDIHGITPDQVSDAPTFKEIYEKICDLIGSKFVMAHNAAFDTGAFRDACTSEDLIWPNWNYGCSLVMSRRHLQLPSYKLPIVCEHLGVELGNHHDAKDDALACASVVLKLAEQTQSGNIPELAQSLRVRLGSIKDTEFFGCTSIGNPRKYSSAEPDLPQPNPDANQEHEFFGNQIVFTGELSIPRREAWRLTADLGGIVHDSVTKQTRFLVIGDGFRGDNPQAFTTGKAKRATELLSKGQEIEVLDEIDFFNVIATTSTNS